MNLLSVGAAPIVYSCSQGQLSGRARGAVTPGTKIRGSRFVKESLTPFLLSCPLHCLLLFLLAVVQCGHLCGAPAGGSDGEPAASTCHAH